MYRVTVLSHKTYLEEEILVPEDTWVILLPSGAVSSSVEITKPQSKRLGKRKFATKPTGEKFIVSYYAGWPHGHIRVEIKTVQIKGAQPGLKVALPPDPNEDGESWRVGIVQESESHLQEKALKKQKKDAYEARKHSRRDTIFDRILSDRKDWEP